MDVVAFNAKKKAHEKEELTDLLDTVRDAVENDEVAEIVCLTIDHDGQVKLHGVVKDHLGGIGALEVAKSIMISESVYD